jgi:DNA end-binding protein Ku
VAIGQFVLRNKESLCLLKAKENVLLLLKIRFLEEIREYTDLKIPGNITIKPAELKMAQSLISQLTPRKLAMDKYNDTYDEELMKIIKAKAKGKTIKQPEIKIESNKSKDLMAQLKASLAPRKKAS